MQTTRLTAVNRKMRANTSLLSFPSTYPGSIFFESRATTRRNAHDVMAVGSTSPSPATSQWQPGAAASTPKRSGSRAPRQSAEIHLQARRTLAASPFAHECCARAPSRTPKTGTSTQHHDSERNSHISSSVSACTATSCSASSPGLTRMTASFLTLAHRSCWFSS